MSARSELGRFIRRKQNALALLIISLFLATAMAAPVIAPPVEPDQISSFRVVKELRGNLPTPPGEFARLGTIATGVMSKQLDVFYTMVWGTRGALRFGLTVALMAALMGVVIGAASAYIGGRLGNASMRIVDAFLAFPLIAGVVILQQLARVQDSGLVLTRTSLGSAPPEPNFFQRLLTQADPVMLAFILFLWMPYARLTYTMVMQIKGTEFMEAARALGAGSGRVLLHHLIPNSISPAIVLTARDIGLVVILQASLTFIGIADDSGWGALLSIGRRWIIGTGGNPFTYWWTFLPVTLALVLFGVGWNLLGDGLNDWLNPRNE